MKAEDTELTIDQINEIPNWDSVDLDPVIKLQAEVSFKAGAKEVVSIFNALKIGKIISMYPEYEEWCSRTEELFKPTPPPNRGERRIGVMEILHWGEGACPHHHPPPNHHNTFFKRSCHICWQSKLREWGCRAYE